MRSLFFLICLTVFHSVQAQRPLVTKTGSIKFTSAKNADVTAINRQVSAVITDTGSIAFALLVRGFRFELAEMESHFNSQFMQSDKYPNASFKGKIIGIKKIDLAKPGVHKVQAEGEMLIHNVTRRIKVNGTLVVEKDAININAKFSINVSDYNIDTGLGGALIGNQMNIEVSAKCQ
jgi:hypothetical protein